MKKSVLTRENWEDYLILLYFGRSDPMEGCIDRAYRDFSRTLHGLRNIDNKNKDKLYVEAKNELRRCLLKLKNSGESVNQIEFDNWHRLTSYSLISVYKEHGFNFFVGQSQKWINMSLKYIFTMGEKKVPGYENTYKYCHIPIDNILLEELEKDGLTPINGAWSRLEKYDDYFEIQEFVRKKYDLIPMDKEFELFGIKITEPAL